MTQRTPSPTRPPRPTTRADRLHQQAQNCLTIAVRERDESHAAALIDEAVKLAKRSRELAAE